MVIVTQLITMLFSQRKLLEYSVGYLEVELNGRNTGWCVMIIRKMSITVILKLNQILLTGKGRHLKQLMIVNGCTRNTGNSLTFLSPKIDLNQLLLLVLIY